MLITVTERVDIPGEDGQWMRFRSLTWGQRSSARDVAKTRAMDEVRVQLELLKLMSDGDVDEKIEEARASRSASADADEPDVLSQYDAATVADAGIAEWSYSSAISKPSEQLEPETLEWAARQIMERNLRPPANASDTGTS